MNIISFSKGLLYFIGIILTLIGLSYLILVILVNIVIGEVVVSYVLLIPFYYEFLYRFHRLLFSNMYLCMIVPTFLGITILYTGKKLGSKNESFMGYEDYGKTLGTFSSKSKSSKNSAPRTSNYTSSSPSSSERMQAFQDGIENQYETDQQLRQGEISPLEYTADSSFNIGDTYLRATGNENLANGMGGVKKITGAAGDIAGGFIKDDPTQAIKGIADGAQGALEVLDAYSNMTPEQKEAFEEVCVYCILIFGFCFIVFMAIMLILAS